MYQLVPKTCRSFGNYPSNFGCMSPANSPSLASASCCQQTSAGLIGALRGSCHVLSILATRSILPDRCHPSKIAGMNYSVIVLLLIANLLTCPLRCTGFEAAGCKTAPTSCGCCADESSSNSATELPASPSDDCGCQSCICEGALLQLEIELPELAWTAIWLGHGARAPSQAWNGPSQFLPPGHCGYLALSSARNARAALQSWQI
jgi:hypothetical protein